MALSTRRLHQSLLAISRLHICSSSKPSLLEELHVPFKGHTVSFGTHFEKSSPQPEIKVPLEIRFNLHNVSLDFQSFN